MTIEQLVVLERFIKSCEEHMLVVIFKGKGDIGPKCLQLLHLCSDRSFVYHLKMVTGTAETVDFKPTAVPMVIDNHIETIGNTIVDYFFYARHPSLVNGHFDLICEMTHYPCNRKTHALETLFLDFINDFL